MSRGTLVPWAVLALTACNGVWGLDELPLAAGEGGGGGTSTSTASTSASSTSASSTSASSTSSSTSASTSTSSGGNCEVPTGSIFGGDFEGAEAPEDIWSAPKGDVDLTLVESGIGCTALRARVETPGFKKLVANVSASGGECVRIVLDAKRTGAEGVGLRAYLTGSASPEETNFVSVNTVSQSFELACAPKEGFNAIELTLSDAQGNGAEVGAIVEFESIGVFVDGECDPCS